ncbi:hypothetical protein H6P81_016156 [Aristolochia fimbriata]|uniref:LAGLIDADG homing endonuclease n=1 Tax=Aristolochia fimbriata TaxID=158543 RepID=A0AAV7E8S7_ARIFI|nr:hypothetical protein H6P81_016156 [Aristolochia fimbriata]
MKQDLSGADICHALLAVCVAVDRGPRKASYAFTVQFPQINAFSNLSLFNLFKSFSVQLPQNLRARRKQVQVAANERRLKGSRRAADPTCSSGIA